MNDFENRDLENTDSGQQETNENLKRKKARKRRNIILIIFGLYVIFIFGSMIKPFIPGIRMGQNFLLFVKDMFILFPPAFILVGLFTAWIDRGIIEKYFGEASGLKGHLAAILLSCTTLYPFVVVLPMAAALYKKGARLGIVLTYLSSSAVCRIPMTIFEASFLGVRFTIIRYVVSLPLIVLGSLLIERLMRGKKPVIEIE